MSRRHLPRLAVSLTAMLAASLAPQVARASGPELLDPGTKALGRGSAFVARADDASAFHFNPAGLAKIRRRAILVDAVLVNPELSFRRGGTGAEVSLFGGDCADPAVACALDPAGDANAGGDPYGRVVNGAPISPAGLFVFNWGNVGRVSGLSLALGAHTSSNLSLLGFPGDGAQRYALRRMVDMRVDPGVAIAYQINRYVSLGATLTNRITIVELDRAVRDGFVDGDALDNEGIDEDVSLQVRGNDFSSITATLGLMGRPVRWLELGASAELPTLMKARGTVTYDSPSGVSLGSSQATLRQWHPATFRFGIRYVACRWDVELDYVMASHNIDRGLEITYDDATLSSGDVLTDVGLSRDYKATHAARAGGEFAVVPNVFSARAGFGITSSPHRDKSSFAVDDPFDFRFNLGLGISVWLGDSVSLAAAYARTLQLGRTVAPGNLQQEGGVATGASSGGNIINSGDYRFGTNHFGLALEGRF